MHDTFYKYLKCKVVFDKVEFITIEYNFAVTQLVLITWEFLLFSHPSTTYLHRRKFPRKERNYGSRMFIMKALSALACLCNLTCKKCTELTV